MSLARKAWRIQYIDADASMQLATRALERATAAGDVAAQGRAQLARGFHLMRTATGAESIPVLEHAQRSFAATGDRSGYILATVGIARNRWKEGHFRESLELLLPLRQEGLSVLKHEERGMLLNGIAGCYSALGQSPEAFAYMYEGLRETGPSRGLGFDVVLYCNLAHELYQIGDYHEALAYLTEGISRCERINNTRLMCVLLTNRVVCLTDLERPRDALADIDRVLTYPSDALGRSPYDGAHANMAIAALRAGERALGSGLIERARIALHKDALAEVRLMLAVAEAELMRLRGTPDQAAARLEKELPLAPEGLSLRDRCVFYQMLADLYEQAKTPAKALQAMRTWQRLQMERADLASRARYQAASLKTELLRLQRERDEIEARRRSTERAKAELQVMNQQLSHKVREVQALQKELKQQAIRDGLTGLFNRRHLNEVLPSMFALAERDKQPFSVVVIDLDHFKAVNDVHGHVVGDYVLKAFADLLGKHLRKSDIACRYGGEEFCLLMPRTDAQSARRKVDALLKAWRNIELVIDSLNIGTHTFSAGVADSQTVPDSASLLLQHADGCALQAKRLGRNRVVVLPRHT